MKKKENPNKDVPFLSVKDAVMATGLSQKFFYDGVKDGTIPHIKSGNKFYINMPLFLRQMKVTEE